MLSRKGGCLPSTGSEHPAGRHPGLRDRVVSMRTAAGELANLEPRKFFFLTEAFFFLTLHKAVA